MDIDGINRKLALWQEAYSLRLSESTLEALAEWIKQSSYWDPESSLLSQLGPLLKEFADLESGVTNLVPFLLSTRSPGFFMGFLERDRDALPVLLRILALPSPAARWLIDDEDCFDWLRLSAGKTVSFQQMRDIIVSEVLAIDDEVVRLASMRSFRRRETLRIMCAYYLHGLPWYDVQQQLTFVADAAVHASWSIAISEMRGGSDRREEIEDGLTAIAGGAFGSYELDFESSLSMQFLLDGDSSIESRHSNWDVERTRIVQRTLYWLVHDEGFAFRVDNLFSSGVFQGSTQSERDLSERLLGGGREWLQSLENQGRTLHRLSLLKRRFLVGGRSFYASVDQQIPELIYRRNISGADLAGLSAFYRRIKRALTTDQKPNSWASMRDLINTWREEVSFLVHYLQLLYGVDDESVRVTSVRSAIEALARGNLITELERKTLDQSWKEISNAALQIQSRLLRSSVPLFEKNPDTDELVASLEICREYVVKTRQILKHMQSEAFSEDNKVAEETDLILDPNPSPAWTEQVLGKHGFTRQSAAYVNLQELAKEEIRMLSTKRCRHFLASIAPRLLSKISLTPDPDLTLENLVETTRSLGGKGVLWELFNVHEPSMDLYIRICGASPYLVSILTKNPGMIDELLDSLMLNRLPTQQQLEAILYDLCRGAVDIEPILASFKNAMHLNVGVRDILGKEIVSATHLALADIADVCVRQVIENCYGALVTKAGVPKDLNGNDCPFVFVTVGKYGSREPNYHSDMSLICLYDSGGVTTLLGFGRHQPLDNCDFFHQLTYRVTQAINRLGRFGRLYEAKPWLATENARSTIAWRLEEFVELFKHNEISAIKRLEFCSARVLYGSTAFMQQAEYAKHRSLTSVPWSIQDSHTILAYRNELAQGVASTNIKRGEGGTLEVELLAKLLLMRACKETNVLPANGTVDCLVKLKELGILNDSDFTTLRDGYLFLRGVESGLRLMNTAARHDLPMESLELERLAYVLNLGPQLRVADICQTHRSSIRSTYSRLTAGIAQF